MGRNNHFALWLTGTIVAVFFLQGAVPGFTENIMLISALAWERPWTFLTSIFAHGSIAHLLFNGYALALFGTILEERIGSRRFLMVFFGAGALSSMIEPFFYPATLGASGAIFGILGTLAVLDPMMTIYVYFVPVPLFVAAIGYAALDAFGFITGFQTSFVGRVANAGHLAGLAAGVIAGFALRGRKPIKIGFGKKQSFLTAEEFDKWEKENMGKN